jgi:phosphoribosylglycinamide formyltransferase-1
MKKIVVMASGSGTLFRSLLESDIGSQIVGLVTDVPGCGAIDIAVDHRVPVVTVPFHDYESRSDWGVALRKKMLELDPNYIVTAGFMRVLDADFVDTFPNRIINSHPALLPHFPGAHAVRDALAAGATVTGTTVHLIDHGVDTGPILAQESVVIEPGVTEADLHEQIKQIERALLPATVSRVINSDFSKGSGEAQFS